MRTRIVHVTEYTSLTPDQVLEAARDFSERRADLWPDVHLEHFEVHELEGAHAEVTEGNPEPFGYVWERLRYDLSEPGRVKGVVTDSNIFHPGSSWEIRATPDDGRTRVEIVGVRNVKGIKGAVIGVLIDRGVGHRFVADHLHHFLAEVDRRVHGARA